MQPTVRRVITGQTPEGASVFTHIEPVPRIQRSSGLQWYGVWGWDELPSLPFCCSEPYAPRSVFPAPDGKGMRINTVVFPAGYGIEPSIAAAPTEADAEYTRLAMAQSSGGKRHENGMHATDTVDLAFVFSGEICLIQGDGSEVTLRPGDVLVQYGGGHAWQNRTDQPCMICFVLLGASRRDDGPSAMARGGE